MLHLFYSLGIFLFLQFCSCNKTIEPGQVILPNNLDVQITIDKGDVDLVASAENVNFFTFEYKNNNGSSTINESNDGLNRFSYAESGSYVIKTSAHTDYTNFIEQIDTIDIDLEVDSSQGYSTPMSYPGYTLVWNDEFNGNNLSNNWTNELGTGNWGWGNNELQYYTTQNHTVANGFLKITAKEQNLAGSAYTSTRIKTQGLRSFRYGRIDIRAKLPKGKGLWPALWMLGENISSLGWPACGEIDIMELVGGAGSNDRTVHGTLHWDDNGHQYYGSSSVLSSGNYWDEFHVFSIEWDAQTIKWYRDDILYTTANINATALSEFQEEFFFIFNVAVGGNWPGNPDATTVFPQHMYVDYVRVFQP
jgi:beta-glucanase (GH16 family)